MQRTLQCVKRLAVVEHAQDLATEIEIGAEVTQENTAVDLAEVGTGFKNRITTGDRLSKRLLQDTGVATLPGLSFHRPENELTARLAYVDFDGAQALTASEAIPLDQPLPADFLKTYCAPTVEAIERIARWATTDF